MKFLPQLTPIMSTTSASSRESAAARVSMASEAMRPKLLESDDAGNLMHWIALQRKTFTAWANVHLSQRFLCITHLETDLRDGVLLVHLLEILTGQVLLKVKRDAKSRIQQLQTVTVALDCLDAMGIRTQGISSFEIVEGNLKIILGLMWSLVSYFQIQEGGKRSNLAGKRALLVWVKNQVKPHDLPVANFAAHFRDGRVLCALVDALVPGELNMKKVMAGTDDRKNLERALDVAETSLDIPRMLSPDDLLAAKPDETSIMTYVSFFRMKWNKPVLDQATADAQRANLSVRPDREAPTGTIRRLMQELENQPPGVAAAAAAAAMGSLRKSIATPVVVPASMADHDSSDEEDEDGDAEDVLAVESIIDELNNEPTPSPAARSPAAVAVSAPPAAQGDSLRRAVSGNRNANPLAASADQGSLRRTVDSARTAQPHNGSPVPSAATETGSLRRAGDSSRPPPVIANNGGSPVAQPQPGSLRRVAPAPNLRVSAPQNTTTASASPLSPRGPTPLSPRTAAPAMLSPRAAATAAPAAPPVTTAPPVAEVAAPSEPADDDAELDALLADGDAELQQRRGSHAHDAGSAAASSPAASDKEKRPKVCELCMTRKVAAKITAKSGNGSPQFLCKPCALEVTAKDAKLAAAANQPVPQPPVKSPSEKKMCDVCHNAKPAARVTLPNGVLQLMCRSCAETKQAEDEAKARAAKLAKKPQTAQVPTRAAVRKMPNFAPVGAAGGKAPVARSVTQRAIAPSSAMVAPVTNAQQFESSSLRIGKKAAGDLKSRRQFRHSVIVQVPARPASSTPAPTPQGPGESDDDRMRSRRLDRTKTRDSLYAADLMAQMEALLAEEGIADVGDEDVPPAPDDGPPAEVVAEAEAEANRSANARQLATLTTMWFYADVTREAAEDMLVAEDPGFFIVRPSAKQGALALTYKEKDGSLRDDAVMFDSGKWRFEAQKAGSGQPSLDALLAGDKRLAVEPTRAWRQRALTEAVRDEDEDSGEDMEISSRESVIMAPSASLRGVQATSNTLSRAAAKAAADQAAAAQGEKFSLENPLPAPGPDATPKEQKRWALYCDWLAAQNITLEEYAMRVRGASRDTAARLASEVTLRTVAAKGTDEAAEEEISEKGAVRAELDGGAREIEIELADMATYVAIADYQSENDNELSFKEGEQVIVLGPDDSGWWKAELNGQFGWVPAAFFERVQDKKAQVAAEIINEAELASAELAASSKARAPEEPPAPLSASGSFSGSSSSMAGARAQAEAAAAAAAAEKEPSLADDGEVMYTQAIEDFLAEGEGELGFRRDDYVCVLKPDPSDDGGWWKGQLPTGEFGWVPAEFLETLPAKPRDWANRVPASKSRSTVKVDGLLQGNVANEIREMEECEARWGAVSAKFGKLWTKDASPTNVVTGGQDGGEWRQRFCVLLTKERRLLELRTWHDEPTAALASHHVATSLSSTHAARSFAFFVRTRKTAVLLAPIASDKEARIERDEWLAAINSVTKETLKAKRSGGSSASRSKTGRSRSGSSTAAVALKDAVLQGKLQKKSFGWSSRWFALLSSGRLQWWDSANSATAGKPSKSSMSLVGAHVGKPPNSGRHHAFYIKTAADSLLLRAKSAEEADRWIAALDEVVSKANK